MGNNGDWEEKKNRGGYMRSLHKLEEKLYSPELELPGMAMKVLLFIRHQTVRWENEKTEITYSDIMEKTGISQRRAIEAVQLLEKKKLILVDRRRSGGKPLANVLGLNPEFFGDIIEPTCRPKMSVIQGGKSHDSIPDVRKTADQITENRRLNYGKPQIENAAEALQSTDSEFLKNPFKEPYKKLLREGIVESFTLIGESEEEIIRKNREKRVRQEAQMKADGSWG